MNVNDCIKQLTADTEALKIKMKNMPSSEKLESMEFKFRDFISFDYFRDFSENLRNRYCS